MRISEWPRMPYLSPELCEWIYEQLVKLETEELASYAVETGRDGEARRLLVATEVGLIDYRYAPRDSDAARYGLSGTLYTWPAVAGAQLTTDVHRVWAREVRTAWRFTIGDPDFTLGVSGDEPLVGALLDFARICLRRAGRGASVPS